MRKSTLGNVEAKVEAAPRLGMLIHEAVREAIERAVDEELEAALGAKLYARTEERRGFRNGIRTRSLTGPTGKFEMNVPRGTLFTKSGKEEWRSRVLPRYSRTDRRGQRGRDGGVPERSEHTADPRRVVAVAARRTAQQERRVARDRDAKGRVRRVEEARSR